MNREFVIKNFMGKLSEAKRQNAREVKFSLKELEDLGFCITELLGEYFSKTIENVKSNAEASEDETFMDGGSFK
jgi:hypothetical protein